MLNNTKYPYGAKLIKELSHLGYVKLPPDIVKMLCREGKLKQTGVTIDTFQVDGELERAMRSESIEILETSYTKTSSPTC